MATIQSQEQRMLVLCERNAPLPNLGEANVAQVSGRGGRHRNVTVVSQFEDEPRGDFCRRILSRVAQEQQQDVRYRAVVVSIADGVDDDEALSRRQLLRSLSVALALRPNGLLLFVAPVLAGAAMRRELLELAASLACGAPHLNVRVSFSAVKATNLRAKVADTRVLGHAA